MPYKEFLRQSTIRIRGTINSCFSFRAFRVFRGQRFLSALNSPLVPVARAVRHTLPSLDRRTRHATVRTKHTTVSGFGFQQALATRAFIKPPTGIGGHGHQFGMTTDWTSQSGFKLYRHDADFRRITPESWVPGAMVLNTVPYFFTFSCSSASRASDSSLSTMISQVMDSIFGGTSCRMPSTKCPDSVFFQQLIGPGRVGAPLIFGSPSLRGFLAAPRQNQLRL